MRKTILLVLLIGVIAAIFTYVYAKFHEVELRIQFVDQNLNNAYVYYSVTKQPQFDGHDVLYLEPYFDGGLYQYHRAKIKTNDSIKFIRVDPATQRGNYNIRSAAFAANEVIYSVDFGDDLLGVSTDTQVTAQGIGIQIESLGGDPFLTLRVPGKLSHSASQFWRHFYTTFSFFVFLALASFFLISDRFVVWRRWLSYQYDRSSLRLSNVTAIKFNALSLGIISLFLAVFVVAVALNLNASALGAWGSHFKEETIEHHISFGEAKEIRSDEWYVHSPWVLNQVHRGMDIENQNIGPPGSALLMSAPVLHPLMVAQPKYWGFLFMDPARGFSWYWATKILLFLAVAFIFFLVLTEGDDWLSLAGALLLYGASYVQWWFSSFVPDLITYALMSFIGLRIALNGRSRYSGYLGVGLILLSIFAILQHLYPPHIVPLLYVVMFLSIPLIKVSAPAGAVGEFSLRWLRQNKGALFVFFVLLLGGLYKWLMDAWPAIESMSSTSYPGRRVSSSGGVSLTDLLSGFFEFNRNEYDYPSGSNQSEAARFALFVLFLLPLTFFIKRADKKIRAYILSLLALFCVFLFWMIFSLPSFVEQIYQALGFSFVPPTRLHIGIGLTSILLTILVIHASKTHRFTPRFFLFYLAAAEIVLAFIFYSSRMVDPAFFSIDKFLYSSVALMALLASVGYQSRLALVIFAGMLVMPTISVNSVQDGINDIEQKLVLKAAADLNADDALWAVFGDARLAQAFRGKGLNVLNGVSYAPRTDIMALLDPEKKYEGIWNRYGTMSMELPTKKASSDHAYSFEEIHPDHYRLRISPCDEKILQLSVSKIASTEQIDLESYRCLQNIYENQAIGIYFYELGKK